MSNKIMDGDCYVCDKPVVFKADKRGNAYYACAHCSTRVFVGAVPSEALKSSINQQEEKPDVQLQEKAIIVSTDNGATGSTPAPAGDAGKPRSGFSFFG